MTFEQFEEQIIDSISDYYDGEASVTIGDVTKNNGVVLRGLTVRYREENICPTVYIQTFYDELLQGRTFKSILDEILSVIDSSKKDIDIDLSFLEDFESLKKKILVKLINKEQNKELLEEVPYVEFLDLAAVFYVMISNEKIGNGTVLLKDKNLEAFGIDIDELFEIAKENNKRILGSYIEGIEDILLKMMKMRNEEIPADLEKTINENKEMGNILPLYVMSNKYNVLGAACLLDNERLKEFSDEMDSDFYIIPSSIHEIILVPDFAGEEPDSLRDMVKEVNMTQVPVQEVLSDRLYKYRRACKGVSFC